MLSVTDQHWRRRGPRSGGGWGGVSRGGGRGRGWCGGRGGGGGRDQMGEGDGEGRTNLTQLTRASQGWAAAVWLKVEVAVRPGLPSLISPLFSTGDVKQHFNQNNLSDPDLQCLRAGCSRTAAFSVIKSASQSRQQQRSGGSLERKSVSCSRFSRPLGFAKSVSVAMLVTVWPLFRFRGFRHLLSMWTSLWAILYIMDSLADLLKFWIEDGASETDWPVSISLADWRRLDDDVAVWPLCQSVLPSASLLVKAAAGTPPLCPNGQSRVHPLAMSRF